MSMKIGDRIRIIESVIVYHHPEHRQQAFDLKGMEGEIINIISDWEGRPLSASLPLLVKISEKFKVHVCNSEVEILKKTESY
ncbi:ferredoxin-thioredoxin reductase, variable chain [cyanobacterium endosymbiont of Braarudosphaera bigelowii]|uniref:Ferredoxin-thioredoxin reductase, variable chain n=2 Tax=Candidatus Atelocyanobacterium thalassae TaxID=713887 RepID=A0ABM7U3L3_9CHRO|nr:ferredoxin-thioredoxin reductase, variable chain [cyanobacterium endosymbiont of Braarudosphaera bigelowii]